MSENLGSKVGLMRRVTKRFTSRRGNSNLEDDRGRMLHEEVSQNSKEGAERVKKKDYKGAIESYDAALHVATDLYRVESADSEFGSPKQRHKVVRIIIEKLAEVYMLKEEPEEALILYTDLKDELAEIPNDRRYKELLKKELFAMEKVNELNRQKLKTEFDQLYKLGEINVKIGSYDRARTYFHKAMAIVKMKFGVNHEYILTLKEHLADIHVLKNEVSEAKSLYRSILAPLESMFGEDHERYGTVLEKLEDIDHDIPERRSFLGY